MKIHEFGKDNQKIILLIHPSMVMWDYFERVIPLLEKEYHLVIPALPGYDPENRQDFTGIEEIAEELENWFLERRYAKADCVYGCSMGGSVVVRLLANRHLDIHSAILDGAITPYQLPWLITRGIALRDFLVVSMGKLGGIKILERAFSTDELSKEDIEYLGNLMKTVSYKTIWNTFDSCNNYTMPPKIKTTCKRISYWYADREKKERKWDMQYIQKHFPNTVFKEFENVGHGGMALQYPELFVEEMYALMKKMKYDPFFPSASFEYNIGNDCRR